MCTEERRIMFTNDELIEALQLFCRQSGRDCKFDQRSRLLFGNSPNLSVLVTGGQTDGKETLFHESEIAASLLLFAKKLNVPIARRARKSLELSQDKIAFVMTV